jgi:hypothetical protein
VKTDIEANLQDFIAGNGVNLGLMPAERYASFDYCFNYFQQFREARIIDQLADAKNIQMSCLQLGFYLASWGMLRGSSPLLQKSAKFYERLIQYIASAPSLLWEIDANNYSLENIQLLIECRKEISQALAPYGASDILATKIMLGVFGNVPAFDSYFKYGFGVSMFGRSALQKIRKFYTENQEAIDHHRIPTLDFITGKPTQRLYTRAKVIDMIFFVEGSKND